MTERILIVTKQANRLRQVGACAGAAVGALPARRPGSLNLRFGVEAGFVFQFSACSKKFVHCNIHAAGYDPAIGYLLLPDAMPILDAVHLLPRRIRQLSPLPPPPGSGLFSFRDYARRMA